MSSAVSANSSYLQSCDWRSIRALNLSPITSQYHLDDRFGAGAFSNAMRSHYDNQIATTTSSLLPEAIRIDNVTVSVGLESLKLVVETDYPHFTNSPVPKVKDRLSVSLTLVPDPCTTRCSRTHVVSNQMDRDGNGDPRLLMD
ncbi:unnamed protein product [Calicophoron daubneyi]|uniref:Uncharacterized protein n=1 Tax=Calicophoron daubneyi TaxID=300641 RepID=A0AAV2TGS5_CALDB